MARPAGDLLVRFTAKFVVDRAGCWIWTSGITRHGYAQFRQAGKSRSGHRVSYELFVGPIPEDCALDHLCRVRHCVNPDHLEPVTCQENLLRGQGFAARNSAKTHCPKGHKYTKENTCVKIRPGGGANRVCRTCNRKK